LDYDDVLRQQREIIYQQRNFILEHEDVHAVVKDMFDRVVLNTVKSHTDKSGREPKIDIEGFLLGLEKIGFKDAGISQEDLVDKTITQVETLAIDKVWASYETKIERIKEPMKEIEKTMTLKLVDRAWVEHIDTMSKLRDGIHLRSYAQSNPLQAYVQEGFELFEDMLARISQEVVAFCLNVKIKFEEKK